MFTPCSIRAENRLQMDPTAHLRPMTAADIPAVIDVGSRIWLEHYVPIIGAAQVAYMSALRFNPGYLGTYLGASDRWLDLLEIEGGVAGYCSYSLDPVPERLKLEQLYLLPQFHRRGLGALMLGHVEKQAFAQRRTLLWLTVNRHNENSIAFYKRSGFRIREEIVIDIGNGFVMDDYAMEKQLQ
jgi:diamine N-acetyltransferase